MTWEELKEKAKELGYYMIGDEGIANDEFTFWQDGKVDVDGVCVSDNRKPEQMWQIMEALK